MECRCVCVCFVYATARFRTVVKNDTGREDRGYGTGARIVFEKRHYVVEDKAPLSLLSLK